MGSTVERLLVRTWNLFHGNTKPPGRKAFLEEMVHLASADSPGVLCLQELPVWALGHLERWSGMTAVSDVARRPKLGPLPSTPEIGRVLTELNHGLLRSAFTGQANAILVDRSLGVVDHRWIVLNPFRFRRAQARRLQLGLLERWAWAKERRICQAVRVRRGVGTLVVGNLHATAVPDKRLPDVELLRAAVFVDGLAQPEEPILLCGDFNVSVEMSPTLAELMTSEWGFAGAMAVGIDQILVRDLSAGDPRAWPPEQRLFDAKLWSDHAPVEVEVE
jgi:endonuclease/exonuclease/phosphatase family metal-dependent hydrolase